MAECTNHPGQPAAGQCVVCGKPFCHDCMVELSDGTTFCRPDAACGATLTRQGPSTMAILALVLSVAGISNCLTSIAGVVLGIIELGKINRGESPEEGRKYVKWAIGVGIVVSIFLVAYLALWTSLSIFDITRK